MAWPRGYKTDETKGVAGPSAYKTDETKGVAWPRGYKTDETKSPGPVCVCKLTIRRQQKVVAPGEPLYTSTKAEN